MVLQKKRPTLASWQIRARSRLRRNRLATAAIIAVVVAGAEWRLARRVAESPGPATPSAEMRPDPTESMPPVAAIDAELAGGAGARTVGPTERVIAISRPTAAPPLMSGDRVELVSITIDDRGLPTAISLGPPLRILELDESKVVLVVPPTMAGPILAAQATGSLEMVLVP